MRLAGWGVPKESLEGMEMLGRGEFAVCAEGDFFFELIFRSGAIRGTRWRMLSGWNGLSGLG